LTGNIADFQHVQLKIYLFCILLLSSSRISKDCRW